MTGFRGCGKYATEDAALTAKRVLAGTHVAVPCPFREPDCWHLEAARPAGPRHAAPKQQRGLRFRSPRMAKVYRDERGPLVGELLEARPWCEIRWDERCQGRSVDVHEILSRGRGGSITDRANCLTGCRHCHDMVTTNPAEAEARGFLASSGRPVKAVARS